MTSFMAAQIAELDAHNLLSRPTANAFPANGGQLPAPGKNFPAIARRRLLSNLKNSEANG
jgi:hypothetical protein